MKVRIRGGGFSRQIHITVQYIIHFCGLLVDSNRTLTGNIKREIDRYLSMTAKHKQRVPKRGSQIHGEGVTETEPHNRHYVQYVFK